MSTRREFLRAIVAPPQQAEPSDSIFLSAKRLAQMIRDKQMSATELTRAYIDRINHVNPKLNAVVQMCFERAMAEARDLDAMQAQGRLKGPLHGLPMTIKDSIDTEGVISTGGTVGRMNYVPAKDATVVARLRAAGAILLGKTNTPEFTLARGGVTGIATTANLIYGITRNPYDLTRSTSGSSGGAGAIVAAGGSAFDIGSDWGGSIRGPSHNNGVTGIKPTMGCVPRTGHIVDFGGVYDSWQQLGPIARRVEDLAFILPVIAGPDFRDAAIIPMPWKDPSNVQLAKLRVAFYADNGVAETSPETKDTVRRVAAFFSDAGCDVQEDLPKDAMMMMEEIRLKLEGADAGAYLQRLSAKWGTKTMAPALTDRFFRLEQIAMPEFTQLLEQQDAARSKLLQWIKNYDLVISPSGGKPAQPIDDVPKYTPPKPAADYTRIHNSTGWPAVVVRAGTSPEKLPIGVQIVAQPWREDVALAASAFVESKTGGWQKPSI
jgi:amidase